MSFRHPFITDFIYQGAPEQRDRFKTNFYKAVGSGQMPDANLLPGIINDKEDDQ